MTYNSDCEPLHAKCSIRDAMMHQSLGLLNEIKNLPEQKMKASPRDQLIEELAEKYSINIPVVNDLAPSAATHEVDIDVSRDPRRSFMGGGPATAKGTEITISVSYTGDKEVFRMHAGSHTMDYPLARLGDATIMFSWRGSNLDSVQVRKEFDSKIVAINQHLQGMRAELGNFNDTLKTEAASAITARFDKLKRDDDLLGGLGFGGPKGSP